MQKYKKRADGRYLAQVKIGYQEDGKPKYKNLYARSQTKLDEKVTAFKSDLQKGIIIDDKNMTLAEWAWKWLDIYKQNVGYNTKKRYEDIIKKQIIPYIGNFKIGSLERAEVQNLINNLTSEYSYSTIKKVKETLNQIYKEACRNHLTYTNPVDGVALPKQQQKERVALSDSDITKLNFFCRNYLHGDFIMTLLYTGMRRGEILALTWNDVNLEEATISINKAIEYRRNTPHIKEPKTKKSIRKIPIPTILMPYLHKSKQNATSDIVFPDTKGQYRTETSIKRLWQSFLKQYNYFLNPKLQELVHQRKDKIEANKKISEIETVAFTMHQFRHTYATILYKAGVDVKTAQEFMGHSSIDVTLDIYTHLDKKLKQKGAEKLNSFLDAAAE